MQVSCKVSYSVIVYAERQGVQLESFFESYETPVEILKDPSCWISVRKMEEFLTEISQLMNLSAPEKSLREIGQYNYELKAWGVLDSVLKMVESPRDIFSQPDRFLSYFLTPYPELKIEKLEDNRIIFELTAEPVVPLVLSYLIGAVEGLPLYMGMPLAAIDRLNPKRFQITWHDDQESLFDEQEKMRRQFHPEIVESVIRSLKDQQQDSSSESQQPSMANEAFEKMVSIEVEKRMGEWLVLQKDFDASFFKIKNDFYKMYDYFTRAQQLITLISPSARKASVREAMRRVDWDHVQKEFPRMVEGACDTLLAMKDSIKRPLAQPSSGENTKTETLPAETPLQSENSVSPRKSTNLNDLIDSVVEKLTLGKHFLKIDKQLMLDKEIPLEAESFADALTDLLNQSISQSTRGTEVQITTRPLGGSKIQIEIKDSGLGFAPEKLEHIFSERSDRNLLRSQQIIQKHRGQISISSEQGIGSTYLIELPV